MSRTSLEVRFEPAVLKWARERAGLSDEKLAKKIGIRPERISAWEESGVIKLAQAEKLAKATYTPLGFLYLAVPPDERLPLPDFRTIGGRDVARPSPDLLDVIDDTQRRQDWYRDYLVSTGAQRLDFVGSISLQTPVNRAAEQINAKHGLSTAARAEATTWEDALRLEIERIEESGLLVMRSGIVGNNTHRRLDVNEFRGFAISDEFAPIVFLNGRDALAAQMFTLIHELVHIWLGMSGVSNLERTYAVNSDVERYCNAVAAEILVPATELADAWRGIEDRRAALGVLARRFKVSSLVLLRRMFDRQFIDQATFRRLYEAEEDRFRQIAAQRDGGGDFYRTQKTRSSRRFASALIESTLEGRTLYRDALRLLGIKKVATFNEMARTMGFPI